jgi:hypothetical protein
MSAGVWQAAEKINIANIIENCLKVFTRINLSVNSYNSRGRRGGIGNMGNWTGICYKLVASTRVLQAILTHH